MQKNDKSAQLSKTGRIGNPISPIRFFAPLIDVLLLSISLLAAYALRFNFSLPLTHQEHLLTVMPFVIAVEFVSMMLLGCFKPVWRYCSATDIPRFAYAALISTGVFLGLRFFLPFWMNMFYPPISVALINLVLAFVAVLSVRFLARFINDGTVKHSENAKRILIAGTGTSGNALAYTIRHDLNSSRELCGFIGDSNVVLGTLIQGVPVLGHFSNVAEIIDRYSIDEVVVAMGSVAGDKLRSLFAEVELTKARLLVAPDYSDVLDGMARRGDIREADISDLLRRPEIATASSDVHRGFLGGKVVMVTGAGGSIGSEISRQVFKAGALKLILLERSENALFNISRDIVGKGGGKNVVSCVADIADETRMRHIFEQYHPQIVVHAAAHKHVPMMEANVCEAVANNVMGTELLGRLSCEYGVERFVLLSTDKAVKPSSVMGATKRVCEIVLNNFNSLGKTTFCAVRFGNVLGASGSVVPIFKEQILNGGPVTVTHPEMTRYFMTIPEAVHLTLEAASFATGGDLFILDMGEPVKIVDLAESMIRLSGHNPGSDIQIVFVGVRPGEKLAEELSVPSEKVSKTEHPQISRGQIEKVPAERVKEILSSLKTVSDSGNDNDARSLLMRITGGIANG